MGRLIFDLIVVCIAIALSAIWLSLMAYGDGIGSMGSSGIFSYSSLISYLPILYAILIAIVTMIHVDVKGYNRKLMLYVELSDKGHVALHEILSSYLDRLPPLPLSMKPESNRSRQ